MDLNDTRQIPMWMANPALPVVAGGLLFAALGLVSVFGDGAPPPPPATGSPSGPATPPPEQDKPSRPVPADAPALVAAREIRELSRQGKFVEALAVLRALPEADRNAMGTSEFEGQERRLIQTAGERLLYDVRDLEPKLAVERLQGFLDLDGVEGHPVEAKVLKALEALAKEGE